MTAGGRWGCWRERCWRGGAPSGAPMRGGSKPSRAPCWAGWRQSCEGGGRRWGQGGTETAPGGAHQSRGGASAAAAAGSSGEVGARASGPLASASSTTAAHGRRTVLPWWHVRGARDWSRPRGPYRRPQACGRRRWCRRGGATPYATAAADGAAVCHCSGWHRRPVSAAALAAGVDGVWGRTQWGVTPVGGVVGASRQDGAVIAAVGGGGRKWARL